MIFCSLFLYIYTMFNVDNVYAHDFNTQLKISARTFLAHYLHQFSAVVQIMQINFGANLAEIFDN